MIKFTNNSNVYLEPVFFNAVNNKVFGYSLTGEYSKSSGEPNKSYIVPDSMLGLNKDSVIDTILEESVDESGDVSVEVQDGFTSAQMGKVLSKEEMTYFSGKQPTTKQKKETNPLDDLIIKGNSDVAKSYLEPKENPRFQGHTRGGWAGMYKVKKERRDEMIN